MCGFLLIPWRISLSSNSTSSPPFAVTIIVFYCDITFSVLCLKLKPFALNEELYHYALRLARLPHSPPTHTRPDTPPGHISWRDNDLKLSHFSGDSEGSAVLDLTCHNRRSRGSLPITLLQQWRRQGHQVLSSYKHQGQLPKLMRMVQEEVTLGSQLSL